MAGRARGGRKAQDQTLTQVLQPVVRDLVEDMRERLEDDADQAAAWRARHAGLVDAQRTGAPWTDWVEDQLTQAAVGWVLTSVFVRFCEDNDLLGVHKRWISGVDADGRGRAVDEQERFFSQNLDQGFRGYLKYAFAQLERSPAAASLVGEHAAIHIAEPSDQAAQRLVEFWRQANADNSTVWALLDPDLDTRFLGDLYENLSEYAQEKYALRQTPEHIEAYILDRTLTPALEEVHPRRPRVEEDGRTTRVGFKLIDPTCGSGHFLLGAFSRLLDYWRRNEPGLDPAEHARLALDSIYGVDINPFAVAVARFRLVVAALRATAMSSLVNLPRLPLNLYAGDSLLWSEDWARQSGLEYGVNYDPDSVVTAAELTTEDVDALRQVLKRDQYDVVVGNPPYISGSDAALRSRYKAIYRTCHDRWTLAVPFMEQFHALAKSGFENPRRAGWVGQITSNAFIARKFGKKLVEEFLSRIDLDLIVDTSRVNIPGHGTPTIILVARNRTPQAPMVTTVLGREGDPEGGQKGAADAAWISISSKSEAIGYEDRWISVVELPRKELGQHPWSLLGGSARVVSQRISDARVSDLGQESVKVGVFGMTNIDDAFLVDLPTVRRRKLEQQVVRQLVVGEEIRDYRTSSQTYSWYPYTEEMELRHVGLFPTWHAFLWPVRTVAANRATFNKLPYYADEREWFEWHQVPTSIRWVGTTLAFAIVSSHNHFVFDRNGMVFKHSAVVVKLKPGSSHDKYLELLGLMSSSTACFWIKDESHDNGGAGEEWERRYQVNGSTIARFPLIEPSDTLLKRARRIDGLAQELAVVEPAALLERELPSAELFARGEAEWERIRSLMIAEQEELDWQVYHLYGFTEADESLPVGEVPGIALGERAFEIALARKMAAGEAETAWFERHRSTPVTEIPGHLPEEYRTVVDRRLELIGQDRSLELLERPEYKRRWSSTPWQDRVRQALASWILDRLENPQLWRAGNGYPQPQSVRQLAARVDTDPLLEGVAGALELWSTTRQAGVLANLLELLKDEAVPHLAAMRLKDSGLRKFAAWQQTWDAQRAEDRGEITTAEVPVPPKYTSADFRKSSYWQARGKLDVPKERFISYPDASGPDDPTPMLGWAGWDHAEQGIALLSLYDDRKDDTPTEQLVPLVAGLAEVMPWIRQWHSGMDAHTGQDWAKYFNGQLTTLADNVGVAVDDLANWRPAPATRGRRRAASTATAPVTES